MPRYRTPMSRVRGLGAAHEGVGHWLAQRLSAVALVPLSLWLVVSVVSLEGADHAAFKAWLGIFGNAVLLVLFILVACHHMALGLQVVVEDYASGETSKMIGLVVTRFVAVLAATGGVLAVARVAFGA